MNGNGIELLKVENVTKKFEGRVVLENISLTLKTGEILGLIGKSASGKNKNGFFGFLKKVFGSDSGEDTDEEADFDDEDEEEHVREFDEFKEYPEDIEYLPKEEEDYGDDEYPDESGSLEFDGEKDSGKGRLSMQRVMKNVGYKEEENDFSDRDYDDDDLDDLTDSLVDDDDDMSYSFIGSSRKK